MTDLPRDATERLARANRRMNPGALGGTASGAAPVERRGLKGERLPGPHEHDEYALDPHGHSEYVQDTGDTMTGNLSIQGPGDRLIVVSHAFRDVSGNLWITTPNGASMVLGPSAGADRLTELLVKANTTKLTGTLMPDVDAVHDIGSASVRWRDIRASEVVQGRIIQLGPEGQSNILSLANGFVIRIGAGTGTSRFQFSDGDGSTFAEIYPVQDNYTDLGRNTQRWRIVRGYNIVGKKVYAQEGDLVDPNLILGVTSFGTTGIYGTGKLSSTGAPGDIAFVIDGAPRLSLGGATQNAFKPFPSAPNDGVTNLGTSGNKWADVWAVNGTIQTSDRREKDDIETVDPTGACDRVRALAQAAIHFRWKNGTRRHEGFDAEKVHEAVGDSSAAYIDPSVEARQRDNPWAGRPPADWVAENAEDPNDPTSREEARKRWRDNRGRFDAETKTMRDAPKGLRVHELIPDLTAALANALDRIDALEAQLAGGA